MDLSLERHIGIINRISSIHDLRENERWYLNHIIQSRPVRCLGVNIEEHVLKVCSIIDNALTYKYIMKSRSRSRYMGTDISYSMECPKFYRDIEWSKTLLCSYVRDWYAHVIIESLFSKSFLLKVSNITEHRKLFLSFVSGRSIKGGVMPSRSCIQWCQKFLDGRWGNRQYGESITKKVLGLLPKFVAWSDIYLSKRSGFGKPEMLDMICNLSELLGREFSLVDNEPVLMNRLSVYIDSMLRVREIDSGLEDNIHNYCDYVKYSNGVDGVVSRCFYDYYLRNVDLCFIHMVTHFIEDASYKNRHKSGHDGYKVNQSFIVSPSLSSIKRHTGSISNIYMDMRKMFWTSLVNDYEGGELTYSTCNHMYDKIMTSRRASLLMYNFKSMSKEDRENPLIFSNNPLIRNSFLSIISRCIRPSERRNYCSNMNSNFGRDTSYLFPDTFLRTLFQSRLTPDEIYIVMDKVKDLIYSGRMLNLIKKKRYDGEHDIHIIMKVLECLIKSRGNIYRASESISCGTATVETVKSRTRSDIIESMLPDKNIKESRGLALSLNIDIFNHSSFLERYRRSIYENGRVEKSKRVVRYGMLYGGLNNINFWNEWKSYFGKNSYIDKGLAYFMFIGRMQMWGTYVARSLIGYDSDGYIWLPDLINKDKKPYRKQRLGCIMDYV